MRIPDNVSSIINIGVDMQYNPPVLPGVCQISLSGAPRLLNVKFGSAEGIPDAEVQQTILSGVKQLQVPGKTPSDPELVVYSSHTPPNVPCIRAQ